MLVNGLGIAWKNRIRHQYEEEGVIRENWYARHVGRARGSG